jgi:hypothetical protein
MNESIRRIENVHIGFWLLKDIGWIQDIHILGMVMVLPTFLIALWLTWHTRHNRGECCHSAAVVCWIAANAIWMVGEFFYNDSTRSVASLFFVLGLTILVFHYTTSFVRRTSKRRFYG